MADEGDTDEGDTEEGDTEEGDTEEGDNAMRRVRASGERSRRVIVGRAAQLATVEGLEGLSIGRLAKVTGIPKSSVHALFGSKEELQLATILAARDSFVSEVVTPAYATSQPGRRRLLALCEGYLSYVERRIFPGGCFFVAAAAEVGARPGRVHDEVARAQQQWRHLLEEEARVCAEKGELSPESDPQQVAYELGVILAGTDIISVLHDDLTPLVRARTAINDRVGIHADDARPDRSGTTGSADGPGGRSRPPNRSRGPDPSSLPRR